LILLTNYRKWSKLSPLMYVNFTTADFIVFFLVIAVTALVVFIDNRTKKSGSLIDYLLMGRTLTMPFFIMSLVATWYGGIFGVTNLAYEHGVYNFVTQGLFWYVTYFIFAFYLLPRLRQFSAYTLADLVGKMFGPKARKVAALFNFANLLPIGYCISIGILLQSFFGGPLFVNMLAGVAFVLSYSMMGGLRSVVLSDSVQFSVMFMSVLSVVVFSVIRYGGYEFLQFNLPATHFQPLSTKPIGEMFVWGFIALSTLVDPNFYQRCFAAKSEAVARKGIYWSIGFWFLFDICTTVGGMYARAAGVSASEGSPYLIYAMDLLPSGFRGFFIAGVAATILSTLDSTLFLASSSLSFDFLGREGRKSQVISYLIVGVISVFFAQFFDGNIAEVWKMIGSFSAASLLFPIMLGLKFPGQMREREFIFMVSCSSLIIVLGYIVKIEFIQPFYLGLIASISCFGAFKLRRKLR
jgi:SSS family solute:Na+ symporter